MKIGIVGFGREGKVAYDYWAEKAEVFFVYDKNTQLVLPEKCIPRLGEKYKEFLIEDSSTLNFVVQSPGISLVDIETQIQTPITTSTKEFFDMCPCPIIGVTGTKGKGTTATLIYEILKLDGKDVHFVGNIGTPALTLLPTLTKDSLVVYELSSFQLYNLHKSPHIAVCLLVTEDHLDWHKDINHYRNSKGNIFKFQNTSDIAVWFADNEISQKLSALSLASTKIPYGTQGIVRVTDGFFMFGEEKICSVAEAKLPGKHNEQNICAAIAATWNIASKEAIVRAIQTFLGLPFHIETITTYNGITFINDSFATNPTATKVAVESMHTSTTLLIGGVDRGLHLEPFVEAIKNSNYITTVIVYGEERVRIQNTLSEHGIASTVVEGSLEDVFKVALSYAQEGSNILFSPGAPSFDMFTDYQERGLTFNALVAKYTQGLL